MSIAPRSDETYVRSLMDRQVRLVSTLKSIHASLTDIIESRVTDPRGHLQAVKQLVHTTLSDEEHWSTLNHQYNLLHGGFLSKLARDYPNLTATELRLCSFLRVPMQSKEIASLLSCSVRSVEKHRERIRRKLQLQNGVNLITFLTGLYVD